MEIEPENETETILRLHREIERCRTYVEFLEAKVRGMRKVIEMASRDAYRQQLMGYRQALTDYSHVRDGKRYVGRGNVTIEEAYAIAQGAEPHAEGA